MVHDKKAKFFIISLTLISLITSVSFSTSTFVDNGSIVILRSQYVDNANPVIDGRLQESFWDSAGLLSLKVTGITSNNADIQFRFVNDDNNLYLAFTFANYVYDDLTIGVYFDTDADGLLLPPEDGKLIAFKSGSTAETSEDLYWTGDEWLKDGNNDNSGFLASASNLNSFNEASMEMSIPLLSTDLSYDGLQIPTTSNSYIGLAFSITNDFNNGTVEIFEFPTNPNNVTGYVDLRLAGPEDKDLPIYVPPDPVTSSLPPPPPSDEVVQNTEYLQTAQDDAPGIEWPILVGSMAIIIVSRRWRKT